MAIIEDVPGSEESRDTSQPPDGLDHYVCCRDESLSLCGQGLRGAFTDVTPSMCIVCRDLNPDFECGGESCIAKGPGA